MVNGPSKTRRSRVFTQPGPKADVDFGRLYRTGILCVGRVSVCITRGRRLARLALLVHGQQHRQRYAELLGQAVYLVDRTLPVMLLPLLRFLRVYTYWTGVI